MPRTPPGSWQFYTQNIAAGGNWSPALTNNTRRLYLITDAADGDMVANWQGLVDHAAGVAAPATSIPLRQYVWHEVPADIYALTFTNNGAAAANAWLVAGS